MNGAVQFLPGCRGSQKPQVFNLRLTIPCSFRIVGDQQTAWRFELAQPKAGPKL
jgi:hypothetical protein